jgi:LysM repeat protein
MPKHRAPRYVRTKKVITRAPVAAGATVVGLGVLSSPAQASATHNWTGVAECESGGNWSINTGNGYFGGLQFSQSTWAAFGGTDLAPRADLATPDQQVQIAEEVLAGQGIGAWPTCGNRLTGGTTAAATEAAETVAAPGDTAPNDAAPAGDYTVESGDTVAKIAAAHSEPWRDLYQRNADVIGSNPNLIFPGQVLLTSGSVQAAPETAPETRAPVVTAPAAAPVEAAPVAAPLAPAPAPTTATATITNTAGAIKPQAQAAADAVVSNVPGADAITLGGTRASARDPHGHPSGLAIDYMVLNDAALGDAIVAYHLAHWDELGVEYVIWQQRILTSPTGAWKQMADRGSPTQNHMDHVHVNYGA